jgi:hypothetical protein
MLHLNNFSEDFTLLINLENPANAAAFADAASLALQIGR